MARYGPDGLRVDDPTSSVSEKDPFLSRGAHARGTRYDGTSPAASLTSRASATGRPAARYGPDGLKLEEKGSVGLSTLPGMGGGGDPEEGFGPRKPNVVNRSEHWKSITVKVLVPWAMYVIVSFTLALMPETAVLRFLAWLIGGVFFAMACILLHLHATEGETNSFYYHLGMLSLMAVLMGFLVGLQVFDRDMTQFWMYSRGPEYTNVLASQPAAMYSDAGAIVFNETARVDLRRPFGMRPPGESRTYCVAPILDESELMKVQFWAVGLDCCEPTWGYRCDSARNPKAHMGAVLGARGSDYGKALYAKYHQAAKQAAAAYNLFTPESPVFVRWLENTSLEVKRDVLLHSLVWLGVSALLALMFSIFVGAWLHLSQRARARGRTAWSATTRPR